MGGSGKRGIPKEELPFHAEGLDFILEVIGKPLKAFEKGERYDEVCVSE